MVRGIGSDGQILWNSMNNRILKKYVIPELNRVVGKRGVGSTTYCGNHLEWEGLNIPLPNDNARGRFPYDTVSLSPPFQIYKRIINGQEEVDESGGEVPVEEIQEISLYELGVWGFAPGITAPIVDTDQNFVYVENPYGGSKIPISWENFRRYAEKYLV